MTEIDFSGLTEAQQSLLTFAGWQPGAGPKQPRPQTVRKLLERGLIVARPVRVLQATVTAYDVPDHIHAAWCSHCASKGAAP